MVEFTSLISLVLRGDLMAKQKFCCKGVLRTTGQRVAITLVADNKESAVKIAHEHGVTVESLAVLADGAPAPSKPAAAPAPAAPKLSDKDLESRLDAILDADDEDEGLDDFGLGDEPDAVAAPVAASPTTKACPYCGEQILAVAVKCKHCGSYLGEKVVPARQPIAAAARDPVQTQKRGVPLWAWAIIAGTAGFVVIAVVVVAVVWHKLSSSPLVTALESVAEETPREALPAPVAPPAPVTPPKPELRTASPAEMAFAAKFVTFLNGSDEMAQMLEKGAKPDELNKQLQTVKSARAAIPVPPAGAAWAASLASSSGQLLAILNMVVSKTGEPDLLGELAKEAAGTTIDNSAAYSQLAVQIRALTGDIRGRIPPECLTKPR
jgi:hypothetical protein